MDATKIFEEHHTRNIAYRRTRNIVKGIFYVEKKIMFSIFYNVFRSLGVFHVETALLFVMDICRSLFNVQKKKRQPEKYKRQIVFAFIVFIFSYADIPALYHVLRVQNMFNIPALYNMAILASRLVTFVFSSVKERKKKDPSFEGTIILAIVSLLETGGVYLQTCIVHIALNSKTKTTIFSIVIAFHMVELKNIMKTIDREMLNTTLQADTERRYILILQMILCTAYNISERREETENTIHSLYIYPILAIILDMAINVVKYMFVFIKQQVEGDECVANFAKDCQLCKFEDVTAYLALSMLYMQPLFVNYTSLQILVFFLAFYPFLIVIPCMIAKKYFLADSH